MQDLRERAQVRNSVHPDLIPSAAISGFDVLQFWLKRPLNPKQLRSLRDCLRDTGGYLGEGGVHNEPAGFKALQQRLRLHQPSRESLRLLLTQMTDADQVHINYGEIALDLIYPASGLQQARRLIDRHLIKRNHRQEMRCDYGTLYTNRPWSATNIAVYHDRLSKISDEPCVHICSRTKGHVAMVRNYLHTLGCWIRLDAHAYWQQRLKLYDVDYARLGRLVHNWQHNSRRRTGLVMDHANGYCAFKQFGFVKESQSGFEGGYLSIQALVDHTRKFIDVHSCLVELDNRYLLPSPHTKTRRSPSNDL